MKKVISFVVAIALVLSMSVCAFAATEKPTGTPADGTALGTYYAELLNSGEVETSVIVAEIIADYQAGTIDETTLQAFVDALFANSDSAASAAAVVQQVIAGLGSLGIEIPEIQLPDIDLGGEGNGEGNIPDITLPEDEEGNDDGEGSFFDTIFGILGDLAGGLLGGGDDTGSGSGSGDGEDDDDNLGFGDDETTTSGSDSQVTNTGDTSVVAVATVALVAGAALVLTRKKSDDAE